MSFTNVLFTNRNLTIDAAVNMYRHVQVNGDLFIKGKYDTLLGNTNVVGALLCMGKNINFENLSTNAATVHLQPIDANCLQASADIVINGDVNIADQEAAVLFEGKKVWVNGNVSITGDDIGITGGGILARDNITVSGRNFTYTSNSCFAFYSQNGGIQINNGPYNISGLVYTASPTLGDITLSSVYGGRVCGGLMAARDIFLTGGNASHNMINVGNCSLPPKCENYCSA